MSIILLTDAGCAGAQTSIPIAEDPGVAAAIRLLEAYVEDQITYQGLPGISMGIVHDQDLIWSRGFGFGDLEQRLPVSSETIYRIGSISKLFTSIAVLKLRDESKLRLDDRVDAHLPWFRPKNSFPETPPISIRHLLTHTSGLPSNALSSYWNSFEFPSSQEVAEGIRQQETVLPTQSRFKYSNLGFSVAGRLVSEVSGTSFEQFVRDQILEPLSMNSTFPGLPEEARPRLAIGLGRRMPDGTRQVLPYSETRGITPAAGFSSTVTDLARLASWIFRLLDGEEREVLNSYALREMLSVQWLHPSWEWGWGLGFEILHTPDRNLAGHGGLVGGYRCAFYLSPQEKVAVIALANAVDTKLFPGQPYSIVDKAFAWVAPAIEKAVVLPDRNEELDPEWDRYVGTYRAWWTDLRVLILKGSLVLIYPQAENPGEYILTLVPDRTGGFRVEGDGFDETGEVVKFESNDSGEVVGMRLGDDYYERGRAAARLRLAPFGSFAAVTPFAGGKRRALRRMPAARETLGEIIGQCIEKGSDSLSRDQTGGKSS
jgi:CubicO group peptidase (beta-lactamase class C family)